MISRTAVFLLFTLPAFAAANGETVSLWEKGAPGSEAMAGKPEAVTKPDKQWDSVKVSSIHNPSLLVYLPPKNKATGAAMIVAPGGGHRFLSIDTEGTNVAEYLNSQGVAAFVLKYRLAREQGSTYKIDVDALADAQRAIRMLRTRAAEWNLNPAKIGIMGFSAGGEVAVLASTRFDAGKADSADPIERQNSKPDYQVLIYPGIRPENYTVTKETPPTFLLAADNDRGPSTAIPALYLALKKAGVPAELHVYNSGGHGFGLQPTDTRPNVIYSTWAVRLKEWMADVGMSPVK
ncbi:MAG: alpha/beta hydrolase [Acidobacteriia bacterium]|nr:alpha/beta hydrolase [Terriglobia bacterium]